MCDSQVCAVNNGKTELHQTQLQIKWDTISFFWHATCFGHNRTARGYTQLQKYLSFISVYVFLYFISLYGAETWTLRAADQKHLESFEMWCWRRMEKISLTDHVRNEVLFRVNEQRNIQHEISKQKANWIGHILHRDCLLKQVIEGKVKGRI
jgi:hypothetical protein